jgi:hypothetical protein
MKSSNINNEQDFIDYMSVFGTHVRHIFGEHCITIDINLNSQNSSIGFNCQTSKGDKHYLSFKIDGENATFKECLDIIICYNRDRKLKELFNET